MSIVSVEYCSASDAAAHVPQEPSVAISIRSPERVEAVLNSNFVDVLRLQFHDVLPGDAKRPDAVLFTQEQAKEVIRFLRRHRGSCTDLRLLVHCESGISRSAAVAVFAASECELPLCGRLAFLNTWVLKQLVDTAYPQNEFGV